MNDEIDILKDVAARLERAGIAYMLTGSLAMSFYAQPRMTRDIDLVVALEGQDCAALEQALGSDYYLSDDAVRNAVAREGTFNAIHMGSVVKVDFIVRKREAYRRIEFDRRQRAQLGDFPVWIASKEDLILSKLWWARDSQSEMQLKDVRNLLASGCDRAYLDAWAQTLGVTASLRSCGT
jgi:hypothetical protein